MSSGSHTHGDLHKQASQSQGMSWVKRCLLGVLRLSVLGSEINDAFSHSTVGADSLCGLIPPCQQQADGRRVAELASGWMNGTCNHTTHLAPFPKQCFSVPLTSRISQLMEPWNNGGVSAPHWCPALWSGVTCFLTAHIGTEYPL